MDKLKNAFLILLMIAIVAGTVYGVYWEIQTFNERINSEAQNNSVTTD